VKEKEKGFMASIRSQEDEKKALTSTRSGQLGERKEGVTVFQNMGRREDAGDREENLTFLTGIRIRR